MEVTRKRIGSSSDEPRGGTRVGQAMEPHRGRMRLHRLTEKDAPARVVTSRRGAEVGPLGSRRGHREETSMLGTSRPATHHGSRGWCTDMEPVTMGCAGTQCPDASGQWLDGVAAVCINHSPPPARRPATHAGSSG